MINKDRLHSVLSHVVAEFDMKNWHYKTEETCETIETYFGVLIPVTLIGVVENKEFVLHVYVKLPSADESQKTWSGYIWDAEIYVYSNFVPVWKRLPNVNIDELIPPCYYADATPSNQCLVLKNMKYEGFRTYKERFLDFEHVIVSLKSFGQFHAYSLIIKNNHDNDNVSMGSVLRPYTDVYPPELNLTVLNTFRRHSQLFKGSKYERYWEQTLANYKTLAEDSTTKVKCLVYGHGDYWKENIMYKYEKNNPVKACILDFQTCRLMSLAYDFLYFILNSTDEKLRRRHYHSFLTEYYSNFKNTLLNHGIELELFYKKEDFISDLKTVASFCFTRICMAFSLWLGFESNTLIKSKNSFVDDKQREKQLHYFKEILINIMEDLHSYGYISW